MIRGLYLRHPSSFRHDTGGHPENARRLTAIEEAMSERDWLGLELVEAPAATREQLERVHSAAHVDSIEAFSVKGGGMIDVDTVASEGSWEAAQHAAGGAVHAAERLLDEGGFAFCGLRPPGHHACSVFNLPVFSSGYSEAMSGLTTVSTRPQPMPVMSAPIQITV